MDRISKRRRGLPDLETYNRDGHWEREFSVRSEPWPIIEHWISENDYHLVAIKGKRRLYQKGENHSTFVTLLDVRYDGRYVSMISWIHVGWIPRLLSLFFYGSSLELTPDGYVGVIRRRKACEDMNALLFRLKQPAILGSQGFHLADVDLTTLLLGVLVFLPQLYFLTRTGMKVEIQKGLSPLLLSAIGKTWLILSAIALVMLVAHHSVFVRRLRQVWIKWTSLGVGALAFVAVSIWLQTTTTTEMAHAKVLYHCLYKYEAYDCMRTLNRLSPREQKYVEERIQHLQEELAARETPSNSTPR